MLIFPIKALSRPGTRIDILLRWHENHLHNPLKNSDEEEANENFTPDFSDIRGEGIGHDMSSDSSSEEDEIVDFDDLQEVCFLLSKLLLFLFNLMFIL